MDDHLFVNLRTAYSRLVTVREMAISYFACFPPAPPPQPHPLHQAVAHSMCGLSPEPLRTATSWESAVYWSRDKCEREMRYLALFLRL